MLQGLWSLALQCAVSTHIAKRTNSVEIRDDAYMLRGFLLKNEYIFFIDLVSSPMYSWSTCGYWQYYLMFQHVALIVLIRQNDGQFRLWCDFELNHWNNVKATKAFFKFLLMWFWFEWQNAMESTEFGPTVERLLDSVYLRSGAGLRRAQNSNLSISHLQGTQGSFHLSQVQNITHLTF